jgi:hypothetical protein
VDDGDQCRRDRRDPTGPVPVGATVNCDRCGQTVGFVSFTVTVWVGDEQVGEATICANCGAFIGNAQIRTPRELER